MKARVPALLVFSPTLAVGAAALSLALEDRALEEFRSAADCADCHLLIAVEWSQSAHGNSGTSGLEVLARLPIDVRERVSRYYLPTATLAGPALEPPEVRSVFAERGVDCIACHMDADYRMHGSAGLAAPHGVIRDPNLQSVEACLPCHGQGDELDQVSAWEQSGLEQGQIICQSCHMPDSRRQLVQHWALGELPERSSHDHFFRAASDPDFMSTAVSLTVESSGSVATATLKVGVIGHDLPGIAFRQLVLETRGVAADGAIVWSEEELIDGILHDNRLRTGETRSHEYPVRGASAIVANLRYRKAPGLEEGSVELARAIAEF